jgi:mannobiose 2-epimerase
MKYELLQLKQELKEELTHNILPFWMDKMSDVKHGGFYGQMTGKDQLIPNAPKGGVLNARILWTFSAASLYFKNPVYIEYALRAKDFIFNHFFDDKNGGVYWELYADGSPSDTKKQIYNQAFFLYGLVEFCRATGDKDSLNKAIELFLLIERHSFDTDANGYFEAYSKDWVLLDDLRLSEKDANEKKTMNTHLHILEAYTNLLRVWDNQLLEKQLRNLIELFLDKIVNNQTFHLDLFFDENWNCKSTLHSYGHDIEAAWLLDEAAQVLGDIDLIRKVQVVTLKIANAAIEGLQSNGSIWNEKNYATGHVDTNCDWWPQAESMVGFFNAYEHTKDEVYARITLAAWEFIKENLVDRKKGEWHWSVSDTGEVDDVNDKAGFWKCPYHNSRMCFELMMRIHGR